MVCMVGKLEAARSDNPLAKWQGLRHAEPSRYGLWHGAAERTSRSAAHRQQGVNRTRGAENWQQRSHSRSTRTCSP